MRLASVQILLSTWNGAQWLPELLESLLRQTYEDWQLLIRDDGSTDDTLPILLDFQAAHPNKIANILVDGIHLGSTRSFSLLAEASAAPFVMFCDQDDVWFPEKIEAQHNILQRMQASFGEHIPLLTHSDLVIVDANKQLLTTSFWNYRGLNIEQDKRAYLLDNVVTGCATACNQTAIRLAFPAPPQAMQHDRWLALVCVWFGQIQALSHPLLLYRQHNHNEIGAERTSFTTIEPRIQAWAGQAEAFLQRYGSQLTPDDYQWIKALVDLRQVRGWERRQHIMRHRLFKQDFMANVALLLFA